MTPTATGETQYKFRLANTPKVADILSIDQQRWEAAGSNFAICTEHLRDSADTGATQAAAEQTSR